MENFFVKKETSTGASAAQLVECVPPHTEAVDQGPDSTYSPGLLTNFFRGPDFR